MSSPYSMYGISEEEYKNRYTSHSAIVKDKLMQFYKVDEREFQRRLVDKQTVIFKFLGQRFSNKCNVCDEVFVTETKFMKTCPGCKKRLRAYY